MCRLKYGAGLFFPAVPRIRGFMKGYMPHVVGVITATGRLGGATAGRLRFAVVDVYICKGILQVFGDVAGGLFHYGFDLL
ncbi:Uncharacterised protein [Neisseria animaloris]|nr:Uncharacterised protein [Neisseria animaloris]